MLNLSNLTDAQVIKVCKTGVLIDTALIWGLAWCLNDSEKKRKAEVRRSEMAIKMAKSLITNCQESGYHDVLAKTNDEVEFDWIVFINDLDK